MKILRKYSLLLPLSAAFTILFSAVAQAHTGQGVTHGFLHGLGHPIGGLDHILAMVAVGLWASQIGGRALWIVPLAFVGTMALGGAVGIAQLPLPFVETGIVLSVLVLGILVAASARFPVTISAIVVGLFAIFHGYAHGAEMPTTTSGLAYGLGFMLSTAFLHACGLGVGLSVQKWSQARWVQFSGAAIALSSVYLWLA